MDLLLCEKRGDRYHSVLLENFTTSDFYDYQIVGAIGILLKLFGMIDDELLLSGTGFDPQDPRAEKVSSAAGRLRDICIHGAMIADGTGFGKTKQCLLAALLFSFLTKENKPALLIVPASLIYLWVDEIQNHWGKGLRPILSYGHSLVTGVEELSRDEMVKLKFPEGLEYLLDPQDPEAKKAVIVTSYETHKSRTLPEELKREQGSSRRLRDFKKIKVPNCGKFGLLIADEAHKIKNKRTIIWALLSMQKFSASIFATTTPMFNAVRVSGVLGLSRGTSGQILTIIGFGWSR